jgi:hypothetical protein
MTMNYEMRNISVSLKTSVCMNLTKTLLGFVSPKRVSIFYCFSNSFSQLVTNRQCAIRGCLSLETYIRLISSVENVIIQVEMLSSPG